MALPPRCATRTTRSRRRSPPAILRITDKRDSARRSLILKDIPAMGAVRHSVCALDCPDACALLINVDEQGIGSKLRGDPDHPVTRGFLCDKVARYLEREYSPERLLNPQKRIGAKGEGRFERICWDEALDTIASNLTRIAAEYGSESILPYSYAG